MLTIVESPLYSKLWRTYWSEEEFNEFIGWLSVNYESGDVVPKSGGLRKVRWKRKGGGKRGGVRIIYYNKTHLGEIWLLTMYAKSETSTIPAHILKQIREELEDEDN